MWQDYALSTVGIIFAASLFPSILSKDKPAVATSLMNCAGLLVNLVVFYTLDLWITFLTCVILFILWGTLGLQKFREKGSIVPTHEEA